MAEWSTITALPQDLSAYRITMAAMSDFVRRDKDDLRIRILAEDILRNAHIKGHDHRGEAAALLHWVQNEIDYRRDPVWTELVKDAPHILATRAADCEELCLLLATLLATVGLLSRFVASSADGEDFDHCWMEVNLDGEWIAADPTKPDAELGWRVKSRFPEFVYPIFDNGGDTMPLGAYDAWGNYYTPPSDGSIDWGQILDTGIRAIPQDIYAAHGIPYTPGGYQPRGAYPGGYADGQIGAQASYNLGNQSAGFSLGLSPQTWQLIIVGVIAFVLLRKK